VANVGTGPTLQCRACWSARPLPDRSRPSCVYRGTQGRPVSRPSCMLAPTRAMFPHETVSTKPAPPLAKIPPTEPPSRRPRTGISVRSSNAFQFRTAAISAFPHTGALGAMFLLSWRQPPRHWSPGAHEKDRGIGAVGSRLLPPSRLGPSGLPTLGSSRIGKR
jgi:hypothetical protein